MNDSYYISYVICILQNALIQLIINNNVISKEKKINRIAINGDEQFCLEQNKTY